MVHQRVNSMTYSSPKILKVKQKIFYQLIEQQKSIHVQLTSELEVIKFKDHRMSRSRTVPVTHHIEHHSVEVVK